MFSFLVVSNRTIKKENREAERFRDWTPKGSCEDFVQQKYTIALNLCSMFWWQVWQFTCSERVFARTVYMLQTIILIFQSFASCFSLSESVIGDIGNTDLLFTFNLFLLLSLLIPKDSCNCNDLVWTRFNWYKMMSLIHTYICKIFATPWHGMFGYFLGQIVSKGYYFPPFLGVWRA